MISWWIRLLWVWWYRGYVCLLRVVSFVVVGCGVDALSGFMVCRGVWLCGCYSMVSRFVAVGCWFCLVLCVRGDLWLRRVCWWFWYLIAAWCGFMVGWEFCDGWFGLFLCFVDWRNITSCRMSAGCCSGAW